jgi:DNA replication and repair protein RecF
MTIALLRITNFRNLAAAELKPSPCGLNIICGDNGSGKTSLLESIYYLSLGRSFRTSTATRLIQQEMEQFSLFSQLVNSAQQHIPVGIERDIKGASRLKVAEKEATSITELASFLPVRLINSQSHNLFESGPVFRRKFLDWGLFYQFEGFLSCWRHFERVLKQRNAVLRDRRPRSELDAWTDELVKHGTELDALRREYVQNLVPTVSKLAEELLGISDLEFCYHSGWDEEEDYAALLASSYLEEIRFGHTQYGPHRADLDIRIQGVPVKHFLSRGQQKLLICAMIIAQGRLLSMHANKDLIYLIDDLPAELDLLSRHKLISLLSKQQTQVFITAIESETICDLVGDSPVSLKVFHVKHGNVFTEANC